MNTLAVRLWSLRNVFLLWFIKPRVVEKNSHQLRNRHCRMCVVELDRYFLREQAPVAVAATEAAHQIGKRAGDQEILLHESESLTLACGVVGIENSSE